MTPNPDAPGTLTRRHIADRISAEVRLSKRKCEPLTVEITNHILDALARGERVTIAGFGAFSVRTRAARPARNPRTGEPVMLAPFKTVFFEASNRLDEALNRIAKTKKGPSDGVV